jgi:serine/threonine protein kinase/Flp pilus assembly protein TadD
MIGKTISHYKILEKLGEGGMGVVYKAHDTELDRDVALKFLPGYLTSDSKEKERFYLEARAASALNHPNVTTIYEIKEFENQLYLAMELVEGRTLKQMVEGEPLPVVKVLDIAIQVCEGLAAAHEKKIVHRDIKSANIMLTPKGQVKIMDFGLAKVQGATKLTQSGSTLGTAAYMSPEQAQGEEVDQRSDIFSFGVVLYELLTSRLPFRGEHPAALAYSVINEEPQPIARFNEKVTHEITHIVSKALAKNREERYQHADEMLADLKRERRALEHAKTTYVKPSVDQRSASAGEPHLPSITPMPKKHLLMILMAAAVVVVTVVLIFLFNPFNLPIGVKKAATNEDKSVAVLPFTNMSGNKEDDFFSDGITEDIITQLAKIGDLKVISRTSVMQYKNTNKNLRDIARDLNVATILEGSVRRADNQVRIVAQLIDATNDEHIWAQTYDKEMTQIFAIQSDVAQQIAAALRAKLSPAEKGRIEKKQTENAEAYQLYLKGRFYWNKRLPEDLNTALDYFRQAIEKDPLYALAYAGSASAYVLFPQLGILHPEEWFVKARNAAMKALEIDSTLAEAHAVLGLIACDQDYDWVAAEKHFKRAIDYDPGYPTAHQWYSHILVYTGRFDEALSEAKRAQELDPLSLIINVNLGGMLYFDRQYDRSIKQLQNTVALDTTSPWGHMSLSKVYEAQGRFQDAFKECEIGYRLGGNVPLFLGRLGKAYAIAGRKKDAMNVLNELIPLAQRGNAVSFGIATIYFGLGDKDKTFEWLEKAYQMRDYPLPSLGTDPLWDDLRADPRCIALLKKMGLGK